MTGRLPTSATNCDHWWGGCSHTHVRDTPPELVGGIAAAPNLDHALHTWHWPSRTPVEPEGSPKEEFMDVRLLTGTGVERRSVEDLEALLTGSDGFVWVDVPACDEAAVHVLSTTFGFHSLAVRECVERNRCRNSRLSRSFFHRPARAGTGTGRACPLHRTRPVHRPALRRDGARPGQSGGRPGGRVTGDR
jgi:hypothetical protein